ncbi:hypothetical protein DM49_2592 [Burkholderia mallei]|nr:hypothetical protein DM49_2592 [Burkholderia mallei]
MTARKGGGRFGCATRGRRSWARRERGIRGRDWAAQDWAAQFCRAARPRGSAPRFIAAMHGRGSELRCETALRGYGLGALRDRDSAPEFGAPVRRSGSAAARRAHAAHARGARSAVDRLLDAREHRRPAALHSIVGNARLRRVEIEARVLEAHPRAAGRGLEPPCDRRVERALRERDREPAFGFDRDHFARLPAPRAHVERETVAGDGAHVARRPPARERRGSGERRPDLRRRAGDELLEADRFGFGRRVGFEKARGGMRMIGDAAPGRYGSPARRAARGARDARGREGAKVRRCEGAKVRRCEGAKVRRCEGAKVRRCEGAKARRREGAKARRRAGAEGAEDAEDAEDTGPAAAGPPAPWAAADAATEPFAASFTESAVRPRVSPRAATAPIRST